MGYNGRVRDANTILDGRIPLWLAVHEAGHLMARIQLVAAWNLDGLDNPSSFDSIRVWMNEPSQEAFANGGTESHSHFDIRRSSRRQAR